MSGIRILLAPILGGLVMFIWGAISHMALPIGDMGLQSLPAEQVLLPLMKQSIPQRGFYFFPGMDKDPDEMSEAEMKAWEDKCRAGPNGVLIFDPAGGECMSMRQLSTEFASNVLVALIMTLVMVRLRLGPIAGALFGLGLGLFAWLSIDVSYWNWYGFPGEFTLAQMIDQAAGGLLTGLVIAFVLGRGRAKHRAGVSL